MSHSLITSSQNSSLSLSARLLLYIGPPSTILLAATASHQAGIIAPLAFIPTAWLYKRWDQSNSKAPSRRGELSTMIWIFATTATIGIASVALAQFVLCYASVAVLFPNPEAGDYFSQEVQRTVTDGLTLPELARRSALALSWQNWAFNSVVSFLAAGFCEEVLKCLPVVFARQRGTVEERKQRKRSYFDYILTSALAFGAIEGMVYLYVETEGKNKSWPEIALTLAERFVIAQLGHLALASLTAARATRRDYLGDKLSWLEVVAPASLLHGAADFVCLAASAFSGNVGWVHPQGRIFWGLATVYLGIFGSAAWWARKEWKGIERREIESKRNEAK